MEAEEPPPFMSREYMSGEGKAAWVLGSGFLGTELARQARAAGMRLITVDSRAAADIQGDAADPATLRCAQSLLQPTVIYCCMATHGGTAADYARTYLDPIRQLVRKVPQARLIFCSSTSLYGDSGGKKLTETAPLAITTGRQEILLQAEHAVLRTGGVVARLTALYGPGRCELLRRHLAGEPRLPGKEGRHLNYLHVEDAARALLTLAGQPEKTFRLFHVCSENLVKGDVYRMLEELTGIAASTEDAPPATRGCTDKQIDCSRLRALGWSPHWQFRDFVRARIAC